jgi:DNA repair ATPase RecN
MKINLDLCTEHDKQNKNSIGNAAGKAGKASERLDMLETRFQAFSESESIHARKADELEKLAGDHSTQLQKIQAAASHNEHIGDAVKSMKEELQGLRQRLLEVQNRKPSPPPKIQDFSIAKGSCSL